MPVFASQAFTRRRLPRLQTSNCSLLLIYLPWKDERLNRPGWLTYSGRFTHVSGHPSAAGRAQDTERLPNNKLAWMSMSITDLYSAESWNISTALCVLSGSDEIRSFSATVWSCCWWAPGHGDCPVASSRRSDQRLWSPDDRKSWAGNVVRSGDVEWLTVNDVGWECLRLMYSSRPGTRQPCTADSTVTYSQCVVDTFWQFNSSCSQRDNRLDILPPKENVKTGVLQTQCEGHSCTKWQLDPCYRPRSDSVSKLALFTVVSVCGCVCLFVCQPDNSWTVWYIIKKTWSKARAAFWCTAVRGSWFDVSGVLVCNVHGIIELNWTFNQTCSENSWIAEYKITQT